MKNFIRTLVPDYFYCNYLGDDVKELALRSLQLGKAVQILSSGVGRTRAEILRNEVADFMKGIGAERVFFTNNNSNDWWVFLNIDSPENITWSECYGIYRDAPEWSKNVWEYIDKYTVPVEYLKVAEVLFENNESLLVVKFVSDRMADVHVTRGGALL